MKKYEIKETLLYQGLAFFTTENEIISRYIYFVVKSKWNNKKMCVLYVQVNVEIHKFFGSGKVPKFNFGNIIEFLVIAQKQKGQEYTFYLAKAEEIKNEK